MHGRGDDDKAQECVPFRRTEVATRRRLIRESAAVGCLHWARTAFMLSDSNVRFRSVEAGPLDPGTTTGYRMRLPSALKDRVDLGVMTAVGYGTLSLCMSLLNKIIMTKFFFDYPIVIMMMQMALTLFVMEVLRVCNVVKLLPYTFDRGKDMFVPSLLYALHGYFSLTALEGMNLPMYGAVKRVVPLLTMWMSFVVLRKQRPTRQIVMAVALISVGSFLAAMYDFSFDIWSYVYGSLAVIFQATYLIMIERLSMSNTYSPMEMMYMNAFNCLVFFLIADLVQDEIRDAFMYLMTSASSLFIFCFVCLMVLGFVLNYAMFMCTAVNSALTTSILGNLKAALQTFVGYYMSVYLFYDIVPNFINGVGLIITIGGVAAYSYYKLLEKQRNPKPSIPTGRL